MVLRVFHPRANVVEVVVAQTLGGNPVLNVLHYTDPDHAGPYDAAAVRDLADGVMDHWHSNVLPAQSSNLHLVSVTSTDLTISTGQQHVSTAHTGAGGAAAEYLPPANAANIKLRTGTRGGTQRGRVYMAGVSRDTVDSGTWTAGAYTTIQSAWDAFLSGAGAVSYGLGREFQWGILSRKLSTCSKILTVTLDLLPRTQRRRQQDRG